MNWEGEVTIVKVYLKHNRKSFAVGIMKDDRVEMFKALLEWNEKYKHVNISCNEF